MLPRPDPAPPGDPALHLAMAADPPAVREALVRLTTSAPISDLSPDHRATAELVLAEVLNNVAEHAYAGCAGPVPGAVSVSLWLTGTGLSCLVVDSGHPMPGGTLPGGRLPETELPEGGFGWHLIRSLTKGLDYARVGGQNRLSFVIPRHG